jgi:serine-type D-Ala-D-Ala carboxypeptidase (penicillin-binding protein 5/6)
MTEGERARPRSMSSRAEVKTQMCDGACAGQSFVANFRLMKWRNRISFFCALVSVAALSAWGQDAAETEAVRPSGIAPGPVRKAQPVTAKDKRDADISPTPVRKSESTKSSRTRSRRAHAKSKKTAESEAAAPTEYTPEGIPKTGAASVIVVDANTGKTLYEKNADQIRAPASTQKLLTALIVAERGFLDQPVTVQPVDTMAEPVKLNVKAGDTYQRMDLLRALLVKSPNDVARCLARDNAGSAEAFAEAMNKRARELGALNSHFVNPNGLPIPGQYSTARDLSLIARAAYANPTIRSIVCLPQLVFRYANGRTRELENTNKVLRRLPYCNGMKTGYTEAAGHCLICSGSRGGRDIIVVVLGDSKAGVWRDASALLSWGLWM